MTLQYNLQNIWRWLFSGLLHHVIWHFNIFSELLDATKESVKFYQTTRYNNPKDSHHSHHHKNPKAHRLFELEKRQGYRT